VAKSLVGADGRQVRKVVTDAMSRTIETVLDPGKLTLAQLQEAASASRPGPPTEVGMQRHRQVAAAPQRRASETWEAIGQLISARSTDRLTYWRATLIKPWNTPAPSGEPWSRQDISTNTPS